jgi:hypothetical protein
MKMAQNIFNTIIILQMMQLRTMINVKPIIQVTVRIMQVEGRIIIRPYGHHQKPMVQLCGVLKSGLQIGCVIV